MAELHIYKSDHMRIKIKDLDNGGSIEAQSVEANLMFAILEKLDEIKNGLIDVENAVERN